jgi:serine/threonine protein kinase
MPRIGDVIADKYRLDGTVGSGGMGVVYAATFLPAGQPVALKFVRHDPEKSDEAGKQATSRLAKEARALAQLRSDHVARVHDAGVTEDGSSYLVMELLEGSTLDAVVQKEGPLSAARASECIIQACHGLGEAHARGIIHRDVKPSNLFSARIAGGQSQLKVIDFGIARATFNVEEATRSNETRTGAFLGSPPFMSPEQIHAAKHVDARTDVWSLGVVLYYLVSGKMPFEARSLLELMTLIAYEEPPSLRSLNPEIPEGFEAIVHRCMQKQPDDRYPSVVELAADLLAFAPDAKHTAERLARADFEADSSAAILPSVASVVEEASERPAKRVVGAIAIGIAAAAAIVFGVHGIRSLTASSGPPAEVAATAATVELEEPAPPATAPPPSEVEKPALTAHTKPPVVSPKGRSKPVRSKTLPAARPPVRENQETAASGHAALPTTPD